MAQSGSRHSQAKKLWAAISVDKPIFAGHTEGLALNFGIVNDGHSTVDPRVESSHLLINGVEPSEWPIIIGNGPRDSLFHALPPGKFLEFGYVLGKFFEKPGVYIVKWSGENFSAPEISFRVLSN